VRGDDPRRDFTAPIPVELTREDGELLRERAVNLSPRGLCVHSERSSLHSSRALEVGERVVVAFRLPPDGPEIRAAGRVVWTGEAGQIDAATQLWETGVHLVDLSDAERAALLRFANQPTNRRR